MIKLVASDIDGTLLLEGQTKLNPAIYQIIRKLKQQNIHFVVASGRQLDSQRLLFAPVANDISYISENGAICMHAGKQYVISEFEHNFAMRIIEEVEKRPNCKLAISTPSLLPNAILDTAAATPLASSAYADTTIFSCMRW